MKIGLLFLATSVFALAACSGMNDGIEEGDGAEATDDAEQALRNRNLDHPDFIRKMQDRANYRVNRDLDAGPESICGVDNKQYVNSYDGTLGVSTAFVTARKKPVGGMEATPSSGKYCTGTLISSNLFLTAGHCVDASTVGDYVAFNFEYNAAKTATLQQSHYQITGIVEDALGGVDYAIVRLAGTPGTTWGTSVPLVADPAASATLAIIQHPSGDRKQVEAGHRLGLSGNYMTYGDIDTEPGSSGSGILNASGRLVGVHTNGGCTSSGGSNSGVRMTKISAVSAVL